MRLTFNTLLRRISTHVKLKLVRNLCNVQSESIPESSADKNIDERDDNSEHLIIRRGLSTSVSEYRARRSVKPQSCLNPHILKVSILGEPNVGKSTLTNALVKWKVCPVSKKVHTTRKKSAAIYVEDEKQIVFLDTPGFITPEHSKKHKLEVSLVVDPQNSVREADLIAVVVDAANKWTNNRIHEDILQILSDFRDKKSILVLNKVDMQKNSQKMYNIVKTLTRGAINGILVPDLEREKIVKAKENKLEEMINRTEERLGLKESSDVINEIQVEHFQGAKGWPFFSEVFKVSALKSEGIDKLRNYFLQSAKPGDWIYHGSSVTDRHPYEIATTIVRQVLLEDLPQEIPYSLQLFVKSWDVDALGCIRIDIDIACPKPRYKSLVIGRSGNRIGRFVENSRQALQDAFRSEILLKLAVV